MRCSDFGAGVGDDPGLFVQFAPGRLGIALAGIDRAAGGAPEGRAAILGGEAEQQDAAVAIDQQDARGGAGRLRLISPGAVAWIASAWMRVASRSASALLTSRWRATRTKPAKAALSTTTVQCDSPVPSSPIWPAWWWLSLITSRCVGASAAVRRAVMISASGAVEASVIAPI